MEDNKPSYWAVLPASVRYDDQIRPNCKILYAEISALANRMGYCWADTEYFVKQFGIGERAVQKLLALLAERGYIRIEIVQKANQSQTGKRRIWLTEPPPLANKNSSATKNASKITAAGEQKIRASEQKIQDTLDNNIINNIPPKAPHDADNASDNPSVSAEGADSSLCAREPVSGGKKKRGSRADYKEQADHEPQRFNLFWNFYCGKVPKDSRPGNRQAAIKAWDKLQPDGKLIDRMAFALLQQVETEDWKRGIGIPHASTWINQRRWEDPIGGGREQVPDRPIPGMIVESEVLPEW